MSATQFFAQVEQAFKPQQLPFSLGTIQNQHADSSIYTASHERLPSRLLVIGAQLPSMTHLIVNKARAAVHNGVVVQQLYISRLQLHVHSELVQCCQAVELCKGGQLGGGEAWHLCMSLAKLIVIVGIETAQMSLHATWQFVEVLLYVAQVA